MHTDENVKIVFIYFGFEFALCRVRLRSKGSNKNWGFYSHIWYRHNSAIHIVFLTIKLGLKELIIIFLIIIIIIIIIIIKCNWVVTRWQWLFYMYTKYEIGY